MRSNNSKASSTFRRASSKASDPDNIEIDELDDVLEKLQREGLLKDVDSELLTRKRLEALESRNELLFNLEKLNGLSSKLFCFRLFEVLLPNKIRRIKRN